MPDFMFAPAGEEEEEPSAAEHVALAGAGMIRCMSMVSTLDEPGYGERTLLDLWGTELNYVMKAVRKNA